MKVLIVDNEPEFVEMLAFWLQAHGHEVLNSASALEAPTLLDREKSDVVLLDVVLPDASGLSVIQDIVRTSPKTRIVVMSALHREFWESQALQRGADFCLGKPLNLEALDSILQTPTGSETGRLRRRPA
jgi:DNA-binding response OmpR family regulator